jgi:hypothetical protein
VKKVEPCPGCDSTQSRYPQVEPVALLTTIQASLDALLAISHSPTGKARGILPFGFQIRGSKGKPQRQRNINQEERIQKRDEE